MTTTETETDREETRDGPSGRAGTRARRWWAGRSNRWLATAVFVGFAIRFGWILIATTTPENWASDGANYLRMSRELAAFNTPTFGGLPSAYFPSGMPMTMVPLVWLSDTGVISLPFAMSLLNLVAGTSTILSTAVLARQWVGPRARNPAAWLVALAPALVYLTSAPATETLFTALAITALVLLTRAVRSERGAVHFAALGLLVGYAMLVRTPGVVLFAAPLLIVRAHRHSWRGALRPTLAVLAGGCVLLVPWTIRNGVQVGVWTPGSTNNAVVMCIGHRDGADGINTEDAQQKRDCYRHSPWDNPALPYEPGQTDGFDFSGPDEGRWYREETAGAVKWAVTHPVDEVRLAFWKTFETMTNDDSAVRIGHNFEDEPWPSATAAHELSTLANIWLWIVLALAAVGLRLVPKCRDAIPIWGIALGMLVLVLGGVSQPQYKVPMLPLLVVLAAGFIATLSHHEPDDVEEAG